MQEYLGLTFSFGEKVGCWYLPKILVAVASGGQISLVRFDWLDVQRHCLRATNKEDTCGSYSNFGRSQELISEDPAIMTKGSDRSRQRGSFEKEVG